MLAAQHGIDIVPIYVRGTHDAMPPGQNWPKRKPGKLFPRRHKVEVRFGEPIAPPDERRAGEMAKVREFWAREGLPARGAVRRSSHDVLIIHSVLGRTRRRWPRDEPSRRFAPAAARRARRDRGRAASAADAPRASVSD